MSEAPAEIVALAERRELARGERDFATADRLRDEIAELGWVVADDPRGFALSPRPPFEVYPSLSALPDRTAEPSSRRCGLLLLVSGWPDDIVRCLGAWLEHAPSDLVVVALDLGDVDGAGRAVHELARAHPDRIEEWHVAPNEQMAGWGPAMNALARLDPSEIQVIADPSSILDGDAVTPLLESLDDPTVVAAGWRGVNVDVDEDWRSFTDASTGEVDAVLGYLFAVRRKALADVGGYATKARFYRNADMELSLLLREAGGRIVVPEGELPVHQERHRGYHDSDPERRERESRKTYDRLLKRFRGRADLLAPRA